MIALGGPTLKPTGRASRSSAPGSLNDSTGRAYTETGEGAMRRHLRSGLNDSTGRAYTETK